MSDDKEEGLGAKFWLWLAAVVIAVCIGAGLLFLIIGAAWYAWGAMGALLFFVALLLVFAWIWDRRKVKEYEES